MMRVIDWIYSLLLYSRHKGNHLAPSTTSAPVELRFMTFDLDIKNQTMRNTAESLGCQQVTAAK